MKNEKMLKIMFLIVVCFFVLFSVGFYFMFSQIYSKTATTTTTTTSEFFELAESSKYYAENSQIPTFEYYTGIAPESSEDNYNIITYHYKTKKASDIESAISVYMVELVNDNFEEVGNTNTSLTYSKNGTAVTVELTKNKEVLISFIGEKKDK